jgi:tetratricopeptide (TPR) repeat protein
MARSTSLMRSVVTGVALAVAVVLAAAPALAQDERPWAKGVSEEDQDAALAIYRDGNGFFDQSRYSEALSKYREALELWDHPSIRFNAGVCLVNMGEPVEAHEFFVASMRFDGKPHEPPVLAQVKTYQTLLRGQLSTVTITSEQAGVRVILDGEELFVAPGSATRTVTPGQHQLTGSKKGFVARTEAVDARAGLQHHVKVQLQAVGSVEIEYKRRWMPWIPWTIAGAGAAVALVALPLHLSAQSDFDDYDAAVAELCPDGCFEDDVIPDDQRDKRSSARTKKAFAITTLAVGGAAAVGGLVMVLLNRPQAVERAPLQFSASGTGASVRVNYAF